MIKKVKGDSTINKKAQLRPILRKFEDRVPFEEGKYVKMHPTVSKSAAAYAIGKTCLLLSHFDKCSFRP